VNKVLLYATVASFGLNVTTIPPSECGPRQICAIVPDHAGHTHDPEPRPVQTVQQITVAVSTASGMGTFFQVMPST
jgi:hypothetical protein